MANEVSKIRADLQHAKEINEIREQRISDFWQQKIIEGREIQQAEQRRQEDSEKPQQKPRRPRHTLS